MLPARLLEGGRPLLAGVLAPDCHGSANQKIADALEALVLGDPLAMKARGFRQPPRPFYSTFCRSRRPLSRRPQRLGAWPRTLTEFRPHLAGGQPFTGRAVWSGSAKQIWGFREGLSDWKAQSLDRFQPLLKGGRPLLAGGSGSDCPAPAEADLAETQKIAIWRPRPGDPLTMRSDSIRRRVERPLF